MLMEKIASVPESSSGHLVIELFRIVTRLFVGILTTTVHSASCGMTAMDFPQSPERREFSAVPLAGRSNNDDHDRRCVVRLIGVGLAPAFGANATCGASDLRQPRRIPGAFHSLPTLMGCLNIRIGHSPGR
jgi:hypothetical protein